MIKKILLGLALVFAGLLLYAAVIPGDFRIERSQIMSASPAQIYPHLSNVKLANAWNPFLQADPDTQVSYEGPEAGVGAKSAWTSNKMGSGSATVIETVPNQSVKVRLDFVEPFAGTNIVDYILTPAEDGRTKVAWVMSGKSNFLQRFICIFMNQDKMVGGYFETGLNSVRDRVSATAAL